MNTIGYHFLVERFGLTVSEPCLRCVRSSRTTESTRTDGWREERAIPARMAPEGDDWQGHLAFALRHEGANFEVLKAFFSAIGDAEFRTFVLRHPTGKTCRRAWFLHEWLTGRTLDLPDVPMGNYAPALDETKQFALPTVSATRSRRHRILDNLPGTPGFCPFVRLTPTLRESPAPALRREADAILQNYPPEILYRAVRYLYVRETKSSFEIERLTPDRKRTEAFVGLLQASPIGAWDKPWLVSVQNAIVDPRYANTDWRTSQVYVGETVAPGRERVHFIAPKPSDLPSLMESWLSAARRLFAVPAEAGMDDIALAAALSFAFVFLHPFDDGNGRIHRFLLHDILRRRGFTPDASILPVSAVLLKQTLLYDRMLESFSSRLMPRLRWDIDEQGAVSVQGESADLYRYPDCTFLAESFASVVRETIETEWKAELDFLVDYDRARARMRDVVDLPEQKANLFLRLVLQNGGRLSARKRVLFAELTDVEISALEQAVKAPS